MSNVTDYAPCRRLIGLKCRFCSLWHVEVSVNRIFKLLLVFGVIGATLVGISWIGARATAGNFLGLNPPLSDRTMEFAFDGVPGIRGNPRAWVIAYASSTLPGVKTVEIVVSPTGRLLGTSPADLDLRLARWEKSKIPIELQED